MGAAAAITKKAMPTTPRLFRFSAVVFSAEADSGVTVVKAFSFERRAGWICASSSCSISSQAFA